MHITTLPVYSKLADPAELEATFQRTLPVRLSQHQLETYRALIAPDVDVVINTAMTGDGKSLAGLLPLLAQRGHNGTLTLYPTNELIQDQYRSARRTLPAWDQPADRVGMLYGARLDEITADVEELQRSDVLLRELENHRLTLSNPDILHAILQFHYQQYGRAPTHVVGKLPLLFDQLTFDEFHIFDAPQVAAVLTGLLFLATQNRFLKTLFLSATPTPEIHALLERAGLGARLRMIEPQRAGWYHHGADPGAGWRPILQNSSITFAPHTAEEWLDAGGDQVIIDWFQNHQSGAKAALIVNSVATALRLVERLKPQLAAYGLKVEPNTGITGRTIRKASYDADVLVGTSTVDVGVDFHINLLIFESANAGTFLQRLGRLGRHTAYVDRDGQEHRFAAFAAYALVPEFVNERLTRPEADQAMPLINGDTYTREQLSEVITAVFPQPTRFDHYIRLWGRYIPAKVYQTLSSNALRASFAPVIDQLKRQYYDLTGANMGKTCIEWDRRKREGDELLIQEAQSFRGGSPFDCAVLKDDENAVITYDLFWLLANAHLEYLSRAQFVEEVRRRFGVAAERPYIRGYQKFFFRWQGLRVQREPVTIMLGSQVAAWAAHRHQTAQVVPGVQIACNGHTFLSQLNNRLIDEPCVGLIIPGHEPRQVQRSCYLPWSLLLWPYVADAEDAGEQRGTIAFGRHALLLDSRLRYKPLGADTVTPFII